MERTWSGAAGDDFARVPCRSSYKALVFIGAASRFSGKECRRGGNGRRQGRGRWNGGSGGVARRWGLRRAGGTECRRGGRGCRQEGTGCRSGEVRGINKTDGDSHARLPPSVFGNGVYGCLRSFTSAQSCVAAGLRPLWEIGVRLLPHEAEAAEVDLLFLAAGVGDAQAESLHATQLVSGVDDGVGLAVVE